MTRRPSYDHGPQYPHMDGERELVNRLVAKSERLETAARIKASVDAISSVLAFMLGATLGWLIGGRESITLGQLWIYAVAFIVVLGVQILYRRHRLQRRLRALQLGVDHPAPRR